MIFSGRRLQGSILEDTIVYYVRTAKLPQLKASSASLRRYSSAGSQAWSTPLAKQLHDAITTTGPIPIASFMRQCLTSPLGGYYTHKTSGSVGDDQFGARGDFVTSPEISQTFGELIGIWIVTEWMAQGKPSRNVQIIELGPGRGTAMNDIIRTIKKFPPFVSALDSIRLVEASPQLRIAQKKLLCGPDAAVESTSEGHRSILRDLNLPVLWYEDLHTLPEDNYFRGVSPFVVAHEFFDALPIHAFRSVIDPRTRRTKASISSQGPSVQRENKQWRELLVSAAPPPVNISSASTQTRATSKSRSLEFELTVAQTSTTRAQVLPNSSARYAPILQMEDGTIEISPDSIDGVGRIARMIGGSSSEPSTPPSESQEPACGAALIIDYGPTDTVPANSLRGIMGHSIVSPLTSPGNVDLSADVDFMALAEAALRASKNVEVHGPVDQSFFLESLGIRQRAERLETEAFALQGPEARDRIRQGWQRLISRSTATRDGGMGRIYKAMAIVPVGRQARRPLGFGGDVSL